MRNDEALARFIVLSGYSDIHRKFNIGDMHRLYLPPIALGQYRLWEADTKPLGFMPWAFFSKEVEEGYLSGERQITPNDWNSGHIPYVIDFVGPFGSVSKMVREARQHLRNEYGPKMFFRGWRKYRGKTCLVST